MGIIAHLSKNQQAVQGIPIGRLNNLENRVTDLENNPSGISWSSVPSSPTSSATAGEIAYDSSYFYVAVATNTWKRTALSTWAVVDENFLFQDGSDFLLQDGTNLILQ